MADVLPSDELKDDEPSDFGALRPGTRLGRYELLVPIARGGMARVWAARQHGQRGFQKLVAIKTILPHLAEEPEFERMFLDEARIASGVHHPNVCEIYELGEEKRTLYLAMEWVTGDSLSRCLRASGKTEAIDVRVVSRVIADACAGVHAAHELQDDDGRQLGVVHRDLSPHNILLTADGVAKVCDFGVAKALGQLHEQTSAGQLKGKISYMSPEQVTGSGLDRRSDVFSLGCVLYEATTGLRPFKGDRDHMIMNAILHSELDPPSTIIRNYPQELERIVLRALAHQPILRYPNAERMRFALEEFLTKGQLVTTSNVAQVVRSRIGEPLERRKERIRQASSVAEQNGWDPANAGPTRDALDHRSGVKASQRPFAATLQVPQGFTGPGLPAAGGSASEAPRSAATQVPATPRMGDTPQPPVGAPSSVGSITAEQPVQPSSTAIADNDQTLHGHGLFSASSSTIPQAPAAKLAADSSSGSSGARANANDDDLAAPTLTLPIGPGQMMSPFLGPNSPLAMQHQQHQHQSSEFSSPGYVGGDWSNPNITGPLQPLPNITIPPGSGVPTSNPYGPASTPIFDNSNNNNNSNNNSHASESPDPQAGAGQYAMAAFVGLLFAVLIGGGGFFIWHTRTTHVTIPPPPVTAAPTPTVVPAPPPPSPGGSTAPASGTIELRVTPSDATVLVDGRDMGLARSLPRPTVGQTVTLVVRAKGHDDSTFLVDYFSSPSMEIALKPVIEIDGTGTPVPSAAPKPQPPPPQQHQIPRPRPTTNPNALPDNPY